MCLICNNFLFVFQDINKQIIKKSKKLINAGEVVKTQMNERKKRKFRVETWKHDLNEIKFNVFDEKLLMKTSVILKPLNGVEYSELNTTNEAKIISFNINYDEIYVKTEPYYHSELI